MPLLPATGSEMTMGRVYKAYTNTTASAGANISLSATLGPYKGVAAGNQISMSSTFGGATTPYTY
jgi:hypothetical protein